METVYLSCLAFGVLFAIVSVVLGDILGSFLDGALDFLSVDGHHIFQPAAAAGAVTAFGGAGLMMEKYSSLPASGIALLSVLAAAACSLLVFFLYVRPMQNSESTSGYSLQELGGSIGEVLTAIPAHGCGEVLVRIGAGVTNHTAESFDGTDIPTGSKVVVVEVKPDALAVSILK
ncbi:MULTISPECIES: NfeD family protein [unclassified Paenibacillus]|uniref:NfeD family protein n=1 Tax=unclassified Paenibacillus TaxID=185978 RepID=UPI000956526A|nr:MULTISPECIES: NfeD family protein [unclassified Paenibacillus]ASS65859.1 protease [Paenibacillus sp. RUD330]SIQ21069.1 NfeD-like C-terminal, partner-binding [Paenibacillus sp. RU4X]SIQ42754.1 NfeD-like C-terminal, partner-binding [Paenibacillus sp. RU4T]